MATMPTWTSRPSTLCRWAWWELSHTRSSPCRHRHMATWCTLQLVTMVTWTQACPSSPSKGLLSDDSSVAPGCFRLCVHLFFYVCFVLVFLNVQIWPFCLISFCLFFLCWRLLFCFCYYLKTSSTWQECKKFRQQVKLWSYVSPKLKILDPYGLLILKIK